MNQVTITPMLPADWDRVRDIYEAGIATGQATFETAAPPWDAWDRAHRPDCRLVARGDDAVIGWTALTPVSNRCVYGGVAEVSIYIAPTHQRQGVGRALLAELIGLSESAGLWMLQACVFPENRASVALHQAAGFRVVGCRERLGCLHGVWRDILLLERRSQVIGG